MVKKKLTCVQVIKRYKLTAPKFVEMVMTIGIPAIRKKLHITPGQFYIIRDMLGAKYPCQRGGEISQEYLNEQKLKAKTQAILPTTPEEYHKFYYENVSKAEQRRRRKGYEGFFKYYNK